MYVYISVMFDHVCMYVHLVHVCISVMFDYVCIVAFDHVCTIRMYFSIV